MKKRIVILLITMIMLIICNACSKDNTIEETSVQAEVEESDSTRTEVIQYAKTIMSEALKKPESAVFCDDDEFIVREISDDKYQVYAYVEGENTYGILVGGGFGTIISRNENEESFSNTNITSFETSEWQTKRALEDERIKREQNGEKLLSKEELDEVLSKNPYYIEKIQIIPDDELALSTGDAISAIVVNKSKDTIKNTIIGFCAWDENNNPILIKGAIDITDGGYVKEVQFNDINLVPNSKSDKYNAYMLDSNIHPVKVNAIIVSLETMDGDTWNNPNYLDFVELYENKINPYDNIELEEFITDEMLEKEEYITNNLELNYNIDMYEKYSGESVGIGELSISNNGDKNIEEITLELSFFNENQDAIFQKEIKISKYDFENDKLSSGETWSIGENRFYEIEDLQEDTDINNNQVIVKDIKFY